MSIAASKSEIQQFQASVRRWRRDPVAFVREVLRVEELEDWEVETLRDGYGQHQRVCLKASKGPGKTAKLAMIIWHFMTVWPEPKVIATSISGDNLRDGLWTELAKWQARSPLLQQMFQWSAERIVAKDHPETWFASARQWSKTADQTQQANTLAGIHADYVLFVVDEAGGVPDGVVAAAEGGLATGKVVKLVISGNPTHLSGPLHRACTSERELWWVKEITGDPDDPRRAKRVSLQWAREQIEKYGRNSNVVRVNVFGQFPKTQSDTLLGMEDVTAASARTLHESAVCHEAKILGVDVARFGEARTVLQLRQGRMAFIPAEYRELDTMETADKVALLIEKTKPHRVFIDACGIGGGVVDRLKQLGFQVDGIDSAARSGRTDIKLKNKRAEMWWTMAEWVKAGGCLPNDAELRTELISPTYDYDGLNRIYIESKEDMRARGVPSPDKADALALTFSMPVAAPPQWAGFGHPAHGERLVSEYDPYAEGRA